MGTNRSVAMSQVAGLSVEMSREEDGEAEIYGISVSPPAQAVDGDGLWPARDMATDRSRGAQPTVRDRQGPWRRPPVSGLVRPVVSQTPRRPRWENVDERPSNAHGQS